MPVFKFNSVQFISVSTPLFSGWTVLGLAISDKKIIPWQTEWTEQLVCSGGIPAVPRIGGHKIVNSQTVNRRGKYVYLNLSSYQNLKCSNSGFEW